MTHSHNKPKNHDDNNYGQLTSHQSEYNI